jgi:1,3-beta-glucan synthase
MMYQADFQGVWFNRGLGSHALSQPAREFIVKTIEMGLYSADFITCHCKSLHALSDQMLTISASLHPVPTHVYPLL